MSRFTRILPTFLQASSIRYSGLALSEKTGLYRQANGGHGRDRLQYFKVNLMIHNDIKLSIIIPCYNSSEYIEECLSSVLPHINENIEVIIVNDGSTDSSLDIITFATQKHPKKHIQIINQENLGLSAARNKGLSVADGKYISFLDSDDFYHDDFWKEISPILNESLADIIEFNAEQFETETSNIVEHIDCSVFIGKTEINLPDKLKPVFQRCKWYPWARIYKTSLFRDNNIEFPSGKLYEDMTTVPALYLKCKCIYGINKSLIWYRFHKKSITQTFREKDFLDLVYVACKLSDIAKENPKIKYILFPTIQRVFNFIKYTLIKNKDAKFPSEEQRKLRRALKTFMQEFSISRKIQILILPWYLNNIVRRRKK